jgi:putative peptide-modifying radical SAM enzyme
MNEFDNELSKKFKFCFSSPEKSTINVKKLKEFIKKDKEAVIIFYGGEPLLEINKIIEIIDNISVPFRMQTNGKLLDKLPKEYINKIGKILISLDGDKNRTDFNRGEDTYDKVIENIKLIKKNGYTGEIVARMTISFPDIYEQVKFLVDEGFTSVHWQLDAGFYKNDFNKKEFEKFVKEYNNSINKLTNYWIEEIKKGRVLKLYPLLGIIESILKNEKTKLRCGAGHLGYAITTDGKVVACPIMNCIEDFKAGDLDSKPEELKKFDVSGKCLKCNYRDLCGGRCLYVNKAELWPDEGQKLICETIIYLIDNLKSKESEIKKLIDEKHIKLSDFDYEKYFGPEIIP